MTRLAGTIVAVILGGACGSSLNPPRGPSPYYTADFKYQLGLDTRWTGSRDAPEPRTRAEIRVRGLSGYHLVNRFELLNPWPTWAAVTSDGSLVVAVSNGETDVVVFYRSDGTIRRRFQLNDLLTEADIRVFDYLRPTHTRVVSWREPAFIDEATMQLVLHFGKPHGLPGGQSDEPQQLRLDLRTLAPVEPKRDLWPHPYWEITARFAEEELAVDSKMAPWTSATGDCAKATDAAPLMPAAALEQRVRNRQEAAYPQIAERAKITGVVVVEILLSSAGGVECSRVLAGSPFLSSAATQAARHWTFAPFGGVSPAPFVRGRISFDFHHGWR